MHRPTRRPTRRAFARQAFAWAAALAGGSHGAAAGAHAAAAVQAGPTTATLADVPRRVVTVQAALDHPQGLAASAAGDTWWISSVDRRRRVGLLAEIDAGTGALRRMTEVQRGDCYHPGGISRHDTALWIPVAEYRRASRTVVQCRDVSTLEQRASFDVADHLGCLAASATLLVGANWDARVFYAFDPEGRPIAQRPNPTAARYQDLEWLDGRLVAGGLLGDAGVVDVLAWPSLTLEHRVMVGRTDRDVVLTHEGLTIHGDTLLVVPEDEPCRVFTYARPAGL